MKTLRLYLVAVLVGIFASLNGATVSMRDGVAITTGSTIDGKTPNSAINGQTITAGGPTYEIIEKFEGSQMDDDGHTGYDLTGWTVFPSGAHDPHYATAPLQGIYSDRPTTGGYNITYRNFVTQAGVGNIHFMVNSDDTSTFDTVAVFYNGANVCALSVGYPSPHYVALFVGPGHGGTTSAGPVFSDATTYHVWLEYTAGSGANADAKLYVGTTGVKADATLVVHTTNGTATVNVGDFRLFGGTGRTFDYVIADGTQVIGDAP